MDKVAEINQLRHVYRTEGKRAFDEALRKFERKAGRYGNVATFIDLLKRVQSRELTTEKLLEMHQSALKKKDPNLKYMTIGILAVVDLATVKKADGRGILKDDDVIQAFAFLKNMGGKALADRTISKEEREDMDKIARLLEEKAIICRFAIDNLELIKGFFGDDSQSLDESLNLLQNHVKEKETFPSYKDLVRRDREKDEELIMKVIEDMTTRE